MTKQRTIILGVAAFMSILLIGAGCRKADNQNPQTANQEKQEQLAPGGTQAKAISAEEPKALAYLILDQDAVVTVMRGNEEIEGQNNLELLVGDTVKVDAGRARLLYPDYGMSLLTEGTTVTILPDGNPGEDGLGVQLLLEAGKVWTRLEQLLGSDDAFSVEASEVVATVRGTAFGMQFVDGDVQITVADHQVQVSTREALRKAKDFKNAITLSAGNRVRVNPQEVHALSDPRPKLLPKIQALTAEEKADAGYLFGTQKINLDQLKKPDNPFRWAAQLLLDPRFRTRLTPEQIRRAEAYIKWYKEHGEDLKQENDSIRLLDVQFQPPDREVSSAESATPTSTPSLLGPQ